MKTVDKAYLAGIIDGEGCISISKNFPLDKRGKVYKRHIQYNIELTITNTNLTLIRWLNAYGGGRRVTKGRQRFKKHWKTVHNWRATSRQHLHLILTSVLPFLHVRKKQAALALMFLALGKTSCPNKRETIYKKMRTLNHRGPLPQTT